MYQIVAGEREETETDQKRTQKKRKKMAVAVDAGPITTSRCHLATLNLPVCPVARAYVLLLIYLFKV